MSQNTFNLDVIQPASKAASLIEDLPQKVRKGTDNFVDVAKDSGSPKLQATAQNQSEATDRLIKATGQVLESVERYINHYKNLQGTL